MSMSRRRWAILATTLVSLNLFLWLAPQGLALRAAVISQLFGPRMVRAEVVVLDGSNTPQDYRIDRGILTGATSTSLTLSEADGTTQTIAIDGSTRLYGLPPRNALPRLSKNLNLRILVVHLANAPADSVQLEGRGP